MAVKTPMLTNAKAGKLTLGALVAVVLLFMALGADSAVATTPWWHLSQSAIPTNLPPGGEGTIVLTASNLGDAEVEGATNPVTIVDKLPPGLTATGISGKAGYVGTFGDLRCSLASVSCSFTGPLALPTYEDLKVEITVKVAKDASPVEENDVSVTGGGAPQAIAKKKLTVSASPTQFGVESYELRAEEEGGAPATQAGSHPFQLTTTLALNREVQPGSAAKVYPAGFAKDLRFNLPPGLIGDPTPIAQCTEAQFTTRAPSVTENECPLGSVVGVAMVNINSANVGIATIPVPLYNIVPTAGEPARFGFEPYFIPVILDTSVRTGHGYGVTVSVDNITQDAAFLGSQVIFWGVPGDPRHDQARGSNCLGYVPYQYGTSCTHLGQAKPPPFLTLPTSCPGPLQAPMEADSWDQPGTVVGPVESASAESLDGCDRLSFDPEISVAPDGHAASTPTGLTVGVHIPQEEGLASNGLAQSTLRDTTVALPLGVALNPAGAGGLLDCSLGEIALESPGSPTCAEAAKVGTVQITTPLLPDALEGAAYLATQDANPFGSLVALYIVAEDPKAGVVVKFAGEVTPDPVTGQLVSTFKETPQLPFENLKLHFFGGERAPLSTPTHCGTDTTQAMFTPWSGNEPVSSQSSFNITSGPNGSSCSGAELPFSPSLTAGTTNINAAAFSPLTTTISREDGQQNLQTVQLHMPPGLSGILAGVKLCGEAQANAGTCGPESLIGSTIVSVGVGGDPYSVTGGKVYLTEKYQGAPFGLSIVNPADAGPFHLGKVIVRAKIDVDPTTAALTITTGTIPHILRGIPLQIKHVNVTVARPGFTFNPTNCGKLAVTGSIGSITGASSAVSVPFQVTNCASLKFAPKFSASTESKDSVNDNGASLSVHVAANQGPSAGSPEANIAKVKVELPRALPSRLTTLQKSCLAKVFEANPANCPTASVIGHAAVHTPLLPVPLEGPVIFVSHGGEAFPSLIIVLQGYGVSIDLIGTTFISDAGVTSTTFKTVPDQPFTSFDLNLPTGKFSALAALTKVCQATKTKTVKRQVTQRVHGKLRKITKRVTVTTAAGLLMPTELIAQNGAVLKQSTKIAVTGCKAPKAHSKKKKGKRKKK